MAATTPPANRFWPKVDRSGGPDACWLWTAGKQGKGYGQFFRSKHHPVGAHRFAYELTHGPISDGLHVCHRCDNPPCCNPSHLFLGTPADNMRDKTTKGRNPGNPTAKGGHRKVTDAEALAMAAHIAAGETYEWVGRQYGVAPSTVLRNVRRLDERNADLARQRVGMFLTVHGPQEAA